SASVSITTFALDSSAFDRFVPFNSTEQKIKLLKESSSGRKESENKEDDTTKKVVSRPGLVGRRGGWRPVGKLAASSSALGAWPASTVLAKNMRSRSNMSVLHLIRPPRWHSLPVPRQC